MKTNKNDIVISALFAILMLLIINLYILMSVLPQHIAIYSKLGTPIPYLTALFISISHSVLRMSLFLFPAIFIVFVIFVILGFVLKNKAVLAALYLTIASLLLISTLLAVFAIRLPFIKINKAIRDAGLTLQEMPKKAK